jgi:hypothetical protein
LQPTAKKPKIVEEDEDDFIVRSDNDDDAPMSQQSAGYSSLDDDDQAARLPSVTDPKLWRVRVRKGWERIAAMALMNKQIDYANKDMPFSIISATFLDNIENFIFVEAHKSESIMEAIEGLDFCYKKIDIIGEDEMTKIYED